MIKVVVKEARRHLTAYLKKVQEGTEIIITNREQPVARVVPIKRKTRRLESRKALRGAISAQGQTLSKVLISLRKVESF